MAACHRCGVCTVCSVECMGWQHVIGVVCVLCAVLSETDDGRRPKHVGAN